MRSLLCQIERPFCRRWNLEKQSEGKPSLCCHIGYCNADAACAAIKTLAAAEQSAASMAGRMLGFLLIQFMFMEKRQHRHGPIPFRAGQIAA